MEQDKEDRFSLMQTLVNIPKEQLLQIIFTLNTPKGIISSSTSQGEQVFALLEWAESPFGCGLEQVQAFLDKTIKAPVDHSKSVTDSSPIVPVELELKSAKGINYSELQKLLAQQKWQEADWETYLCMLAAVGRNENEYFRKDDIENFPCEDLRTIDQLWVKYSEGIFGFSVQKKIWFEVGGKANNDTEKKLGDRVGWCKEGTWIGSNSLQFDLSAPSGHLPCLVFGGLWFGMGGGSENWLSLWQGLFSRLN